MGRREVPARWFTTDVTPKMSNDRARGSSAHLCANRRRLIQMIDAKPRVSNSSQEDTTAPAAAAFSSDSFLRPLSLLWRFTRPHTIIGSFLCVPALICYAAPTNASLLSAQLWLLVLCTLPPVLLMNLYITGLNQLFDVEIDRINKPTLPLASSTPCG